MKITKLVPWLVRAAGTFSSWNQTFVHEDRRRLAVCWRAYE
jgi:hypothetical protein